MPPAPPSPPPPLPPPPRGNRTRRRPHAFCGIKTPAALCRGSGVADGVGDHRRRRHCRGARPQLSATVGEGEKRGKKNETKRKTHYRVGAGRSGGGGGCGAKWGTRHNTTSRGPVVRVRNISVAPRSVTRFVAFLVHLFFFLPVPSRRSLFPLFLFDR